MASSMCDRPCHTREKHAFHGNIDVYLNTDDMPEQKREEFRLNAIAKRAKYIFCDELPKIEDDW